MDRERFRIEAIDRRNPFEIDNGNRAHLAKPAPFTEHDAFDAWRDPAAILVPAARGGPADWILVAHLPGGSGVQVPLAPSTSGNWRRCRPIGIYPAAQWQIDEYTAMNP